MSTESYLGMFVNKISTTNRLIFMRKFLFPFPVPISRSLLFQLPDTDSYTQCLIFEAFYPSNLRSTIGAIIDRHTALAGHCPQLLGHVPHAVCPSLAMLLPSTFPVPPFLLCISMQRPYFPYTVQSGILYTAEL